MLGKENMGSVKKDMVLAGKAAAGAAAAGMVKGLVLDDSDLGDITFDNEGGLDLFTDHGTGTGLFLDRFSKDDIWRMMEELQIQDRIRARSSHSDLSLSFDLRDPFVHKMYLRSSAVDEPLCELFLRIFHNLSNFHIVEDCPQTAQGAALVKSSLVPSTSEGELRLLFAEWMLLQDPAAPIDGKMLLPGQRYPGLGVANQFGELLLRMGKELSCDAFINRPLFFHNALLYAGTHAFLNPEVEGRFLAMVRDVLLDVKERGLSAVSHGIRCGVLKHIVSDRVVTWVADEQARPISNRMRALMESEKYTRLVKQHCPEMETFHRNMATIFHTFSRSRDPQNTSYDNLSPLHALTSTTLPRSPRSSTPRAPILEEESNRKMCHQPFSSGKLPDERGLGSNGDRENDGCTAASMTESSREKERGASGDKSVNERGSSNLSGWVHELVGRKSPLRGRPAKAVEPIVGKGDESLAGKGCEVKTFRGLLSERENLVHRERRVFAMDWDADLEDLAVVEARIKGGITFREVDT